MTNTTNHEELISRYLNGEFTAEDQENLIKWVNESPENTKIYFEIKDAWDASLKSKNTQTEELLRFYKRQLNSKKRFQLPNWVSGAVAAAVLVAGLIIGGLIQNNLTQIHNNIEKFSIPMGSRSQVTLADGTVVNLNSDSQLELCDNFSAKNRQVTLKGEAYFEVKSDKAHPFIVKSEKFEIKVTGTKFNMSSYVNDQEISATLKEGQIQLTTSAQKTYQLKPGEKIRIDQATMEAKLEVADVESEEAWVKGEFVFRNIPFSDLINRLERWYNVNLIYDRNKFEKMVYSGKFKNQETIWQVLDALSLTTPISYKKNNLREFELTYRPQ